MMPNYAAMEILRVHQRSAPVDVVAIARDLGLQVYVDELPPGVSGKLVRRPEFGSPSGYVIIANRMQALVRQRFTVAHEIAHFILHRNEIGDGINEDVMYRADGMTGPQETEANRLAADILMPWHLINTATISGQQTVEHLAQVFVVSEVAMSIRLGMPT